ncbi:methyltransferase family protein [Micromonospora pisi]|uniref:Methyltransferase family protein n=1 Tax=Micromonospora pisi TaxID=589240 RepID=A0A495JFP4_9ACTN|nr:methyltransferase domain-containing protein [Micromonospora pisi]RKR87561.1 methyltransferase family protein [Micromonospora pisi]
MTEPSFLATTRAGYDTIAVPYAEIFATELESRPLSRALLTAFAETVGGAGPVVEVGSGPGRVTAYLAEQGLDVSGVDLSPEMVALARRTYPGLRFDEGSMTALDLADGALAGLVAWYSIIHIPSALLPEVFAEFRRVLAPGGQLLLAFQVGDEALHRTEGFGRTFSLTFHRLLPERVTELLERAGFVVDAQLVRAPDEREKVPQAHLLAHRAA